MAERIKVGEIEIEVTFKDIKNLHLSVHPPKGHVTIASPLFYDLDKVKIYAATKLGWIKKEQRKFLEQLREEPRVFKNQESHYFLGTRYLLKLVESSKNKVQVEGKFLVIYSKNCNDISFLEKQLYGFYRKELRLRLETMIGENCAKMNLNVPAYTIRYMKTKWGSCNQASQRISFNIELAKKRIECIEYIVVHELIHMIERNHNKRFILLLDKFKPQWRTLKKEVNEIVK